MHLQLEEKYINLMNRLCLERMGVSSDVPLKNNTASSKLIIYANRETICKTKKKKILFYV